MSIQQHHDHGEKHGSVVVIRWWRGFGSFGEVVLGCYFGSSSTLVLKILILLFGEVFPLVYL